MVFIPVVVGMRIRFAAVSPVPMHALVAVVAVYAAAVAPAPAVYSSHLLVLRLLPWPCSTVPTASSRSEVEVTVYNGVHA